MCIAGIEQIMVILPSLRESMPVAPDPVERDVLATGFLFSPEESLNVGELTVSSGFEMLWERQGNGNDHDVTFTASGNIAVTNSTLKTVRLFDQSGALIADSAENNVVIKSPRGICYDGVESTIIVTDFKDGCIVFLRAVDLEFIRKVNLKQVSQPFGIALLESNILITELINNVMKISIHHKNGKLHKRWECVRDEKMKQPGYITVDSGGHIITTTIDSVIAYSSEGVQLYKVRTGRFPYGCAATEYDILVAVGTKGEPRRLMSISQDGVKVREMVTWSEQDKAKCGGIISVAILKCYVLVMGSHGMKLYRRS